MSHFRNFLLMLLLALLLGALTVSPVSADDDDEDDEQLMFPSSLIVFSSSRGVGSTGEDLWLIDPNDPTRLTQLTNTPENDRLPIWSPEGSRIFFKRHGPSGESLWVIRADGTGERQILGWSPEGFGLGFWFFGDPAGERVYYTYGPCTLHWIYADGPLTPTGTPVSGAHDLCYAVLSPDQQTIAFTHRGPWQDLKKAVLSADGNSVSSIGLIRELPGDQYEFAEPSWSPDGTRITLSMDPGGSPSIHTVASDGTGLMEVANPYSISPTWSPEGEWLTFTVVDRTTGTTDIYIAPSDGSSSPVINLTNDGIQDGQPHWSPELDEDLIEDIFGGDDEDEDDEDDDEEDDDDEGDDDEDDDEEDDD